MKFLLLSYWYWYDFFFLKLIIQSDSFYCNCGDSSGHEVILHYKNYFLVMYFLRISSVSFFLVELFLLGRNTCIENQFFYSPLIN